MSIAMIGFLLGFGVGAGVGMLCGLRLEAMVWRARSRELRKDELPREKLAAFINPDLAEPWGPPLWED